VSDQDFELIRLAVQQQLSTTELTINALVKEIHFKEPKVLKVIRFMLDNGQLEENEAMKLKNKSTI